MTALASSRNTAEILCHAQKFHRIRNVKENVVLHVGSIAAIAMENGLAEPASDTPDLIVLGRVEGFTTDGKVIIKTGVFKFDNGVATEELGVADINRTVYALDDHTVGRCGGIHKVKAGILRDIDRDGQVIVELGNLNLD